MTINNVTLLGSGHHAHDVHAMASQRVSPLATGDHCLSQHFHHFITWEP